MALRRDRCGRLCCLSSSAAGSIHWYCDQTHTHTHMHTDTHTVTHTHIQTHRDTHTHTHTQTHSHMHHICTQGKICKDKSKQNSNMHTHILALTDTDRQTHPNINKNSASPSVPTVLHFPTIFLESFPPPFSLFMYCYPTIPPFTFNAILPGSLESHRHLPLVSQYPLAFK